MYRRHRQHTTFNPIGAKPAHGRYSGIQTLSTHEYRAWEVLIERRELGTTIKRIQFSARLHDPSTSRVENLRGYSSKEVVLSAAQHRIDFILDIEIPRRPRRHQRRRVYWKN